MQDMPMDWPKDGPINLLIHDLPHTSSDTEWWYFNSHLTTSDGRKFGVFACFFMKKDNSTLNYSYSALWALSDLNNKHYYTTCFIDKNTPHICLEKLKKMKANDPSLANAIIEVLEKEKIPSADKIINELVTITLDPFELHIADLNLEKLKCGSYRLYLKNEQDAINCELMFVPMRNPVRQGDHGIVSGTYGERMFYYSIPRCYVHGRLSFQDENLEISEGQGWYDHEFGIELDNNVENNQLDAKIGWIWASIQLDDDYDISLYCFYDLITGDLKNIYFNVISPESVQRFYQDVIFNTISSWKSLHTFSEYGVAWRLCVPEAELDLDIHSYFDEQEFVTIITFPSFWEGRCEVVGMHRGKSVKGYAYVEQTNLNSGKSVEEFFSSVSLEVTKEIQSLLPLEPKYQQVLDLIASQESAHLMEGVDLEQIARTLILPIRSISDRAGKRWRSYALIACCHLVGGDFRKFRRWLAVPELIHTGSLIIDDVQDKSPIRRGGPACHILYGEPHAINAGSAAYALFHLILKQTDLSVADRCRVYEIYFDTYRAAHAGQAIDIDGHLDSMATTIKTRNFKDLQQRVLAAHRLKSAVPAASLARMGAVLGKGTDFQIEKLGIFFESLGIAFQIMDDVLNLRGFKNNLKMVAEDISDGKVTYPIAKALEILKRKESEWMWKILFSKSKDQNIQQALIQRLESCGALAACCMDARSIVDSAWSQINSIFEESHTKLMLRAFSWYILNRHY